MKPAIVPALSAVLSAVAVSGYKISFDKSIIPQLKSTAWPYHTLGPPVQLPAGFLNQTLKNVAPKLSFTTSTCGTAGGVVAQDGDRTVAVVDPDTGETSIYPQFEGLHSSPNISTDVVTGLVNNLNIIPRDDTNVTIRPGLSLYGTTHTRTTGNNTDSSPPAVYLTNVIAQRNIHVDGDGVFPVHGAASKAVFGIGADGNLQSLNHRWHPAQLSGSTITPRTIDQIYTAIIVQLQPSAEISPVTVNSVEAVFYDSGAQYIQPAFYFTATIMPNQYTAVNTTNLTHARISGFVSLGITAVEPLPNLTKPGDVTPPTYVSNSTTTISLSSTTPLPTSTIIPRSGQYSTLTKRLSTSIKVGRYVVRADNAAWVASANAFFSNLVAYSAPIFPFFPRVRTFLNSQYYWAEPRLFTTQKETFIDSVHIADTEVHGNWHLFTTYQNWGDVVSLSDIPSSGYGAGAGGSLAYWILHSCEVIPSETDYPTQPPSSFDAWWSIFNGLHAVMGYRTEMWIADGATTPFARDIARGFGVVPAWMSAVHNDMAYTPSAGNMYLDGNRGIQESMGRASTISVCGHTDDTVGDVDNLGRPGCLREWWYNN